MINIKTMELIDISSNPQRNIETTGLVRVYHESVVLSVAPGTKIDDVEVCGRIDRADLRYGVEFGSKRFGDFISVEMGKGRGTWVYQPVAPIHHEQISKKGDDVFHGHLSAEEWARAVWAQKVYTDPETLKTWLFTIPSGRIIIDLQKRVSGAEDVELWTVRAYALSEKGWNALLPYQNYHWFIKNAKAFAQNLSLVKEIHHMQYEISKGLHEAFRHAYNFLSTAKPA